MKTKYIVSIILLALSILISFSSNAIDHKWKVTGAVVISLGVIGGGIFYVTSKNSEKKSEEENNTPKNTTAANTASNKNKKNNNAPEKPDNLNVKMLINGEHNLETVIWGIENDFGTKKLYEALPFEGYLASSKVSSDTLKKPFYLAYVRDNSGALSQKQPEPDKFKDKFTQAKGDKLASFESNSGSSRLISPTPDNGKDYTTVYRFSHNAPTDVKKALFKKVAKDMKDVANSNEERYFNTHGHDVGWLHVRADKTPKYYDKTMKEACKISE